MSNQSMIEKINGATNTVELGNVVEAYLTEIDQYSAAAGETYAETAERLNDPVMAAAESRWFELEQ